MLRHISSQRLKVFFLQTDVTDACPKAERSGAGQSGDATNRYERPRIIIIDAGRGETVAGKRTRIFLLLYFFFIYCFLIDSSETPANEVLISIYTFGSLSNNN